MSEVHGLAHSKGSEVPHSNKSLLDYLHGVGNCDRKINKYQHTENYLVSRVEHPFGEWVPFPVWNWKSHLGSDPYYNAAAEGFLPWICSSHSQHLATKSLSALNRTEWQVLAPNPLHTFPEKEIGYGIAGKYFPFSPGVVTACLHQWSYIARNISIRFKRKIPLPNIHRSTHFVSRTPSFLKPSVCCCSFCLCCAKTIKHARQIANLPIPLENIILKRISTKLVLMNMTERRKQGK